MDEKIKIGLLVIATGKYDVFVPPLFASMKKYFLTDHDVTMFVFTDSDMSEKKNMVKTFQKHFSLHRA